MGASHLPSFFVVSLLLIRCGYCISSLNFSFQATVFRFQLICTSILSVYTSNRKTIILERIHVVFNNKWFSYLTINISLCSGRIRPFPYSTCIGVIINKFLYTLDKLVSSAYLSRWTDFLIPVFITLIQKVCCRK